MKLCKKTRYGEVVVSDHGRWRQSTMSSAFTCFIINQAGNHMFSWTYAVYLHVCMYCIQWLHSCCRPGWFNMCCFGSDAADSNLLPSARHSSCSTQPRVPEWKAEIWASWLTLCTVITRRTTTAIQRWKDFRQVCIGIWSTRFLDASSWSISRHVQQEGDLRAHVIPPIVRKGTHMPTGPGTPRHLRGSRRWTWLEKWSLGFSA